MIETIKSLPALPGVYLFKNKNARVIYVGKASSLRSRVRSYFGLNATTKPRLKSMHKELHDIDYIVTNSEVEALILECNLIKEHRPRFNVNLKDDKDYPYLIVTAELYPRLELLRLSQKRGKRGNYTAVIGKKEYSFGPYTDVGSVRETIGTLGKIFPLRRCRHKLDGQRITERPCLNYQMKNCLAPCQGEDRVKSNDYNKMINQVILFLQGKHSELEMKLKTEMKEKAKLQQFEQAAHIRDRLNSLQKVSGYQQNISNIDDKIARDIIALYREASLAAIILFKVREGKLLNQDYFPLTGTENVEDEEIVSSFIKTYYDRVDSVPQEIIMSIKPSESSLLATWLKDKSGKVVKIRCPNRGFLKKLVEMAERNCRVRLTEDEKRRREFEDLPLQELANLLNLYKLPDRIEAYDISHLHGQVTVGGMVVYNQGKASKGDYRSFNIKTVIKPDDYGALLELFERRAKQVDWPRPDLIIVDGGKGQLGVSVKALLKTRLSDVPVIAISKNPDQIYLENNNLPLLLPADSSVLKMVQRIRDEVHRYTISKHRKKYQVRSIASELENIPGIGPVKRQSLLKHFGSIEKIKKASLEDLTKAPGINCRIAQAIHNTFKK